MRIVSICSGVFVLAAAGLLDGRRAAAHWAHAELLSSRYPAIKVEPNVLYVDDGDIMSSAGRAAGLDLCLHIVRRDYGAGIANRVAQRLVVPPHREGGQAQYIPQPVQKTERDPLASVSSWARRHLDQDLAIERLASRAAMSRRTFIGVSRKQPACRPVNGWCRRAWPAYASPHGSYSQSVCRRPDTPSFGTGANAVPFAADGV